MLVFPYLYGSGGGGSSDFTYTMSNDGKFQYPPNVIIPNNMTSFTGNSLGINGHGEIETVAWQTGSTMSAISSSAFNSCSGLIGITIPSNITSIGSSTFNYCSALPSINIPSTITSIGASAFQNCTSLINVNIEPNAHISYQSYVFRGCSSLSNTSAESILGSINTAGTGLFYDCTGLINISIPSGVTALGNAMFRDCTSLAYIYLPNTITSGTSGTGANQLFYSCSSLTDIELENGWNCSLVISSPTLTSASLKSMFESLLDLTGDTAKTLTLGTTNLATANTTTYIPEGETEAVPIATIATNKNWTLTA